MKLLINDALTWARALSDGPAELQAHRDALQHIRETFAKFSVYHQVEVTNTHTLLRVLAQKVTLVDKDMNELFYDALDVLFEYRLRYAALGGEGCEFAMELEGAVQRCTSAL